MQSHPPDKGEAASGGKGRGGRGDRRDAGGRRGGGESSGEAAPVPEGAGKYIVVGLVAFSGQPRPAFLEGLVQVPLPIITLPLPDIPAFPNPRTKVQNPSLRPAESPANTPPAAALCATDCADDDGGALLANSTTFTTNTTVCSKENTFYKEHILGRKTEARDTGVWGMEAYQVCVCVYVCVRACVHVFVFVCVCSRALIVCVVWRALWCLCA